MNCMLVLSRYGWFFPLSFGANKLWISHWAFFFCFVYFFYTVRFLLLQDGPTWRTNKFTDVALCPMPSACETRLWERRLFHCVPVCCFGLSISYHIQEYPIILIRHFFHFQMFFQCISWSTWLSMKFYVFPDLLILWESWNWNFIHTNCSL